VQIIVIQQKELSFNNIKETINVKKNTTTTTNLYAEILVNENSLQFY